MEGSAEAMVAVEVGDKDSGDDSRGYIGKNKLSVVFLRLDQRGILRHSNGPDRPHGFCIESGVGSNEILKL